MCFTIARELLEPIAEKTQLTYNYILTYNDHSSRL